MSVAAKRHIYYVSDGTGITAETLGHSLLSQFPQLDVVELRAPFIDTPEKAAQLVEQIAQVAEASGFRPVVFSTLVKPEVNAELQKAPALIIDLFASFIEPLELEFGLESSHTVGRFHGLHDRQSYHRRMEAINFALAHDDGIAADKSLSEADVILVGVSRCGKTPTSLFLAMFHGIKAANYPLIPEDFARGKLPEALQQNRSKCFGLTIAAERLAQIRAERRPHSAYASLANCEYEVRAALELMRREGIPCVDTTNKSVEEITTIVLMHLEKARRYAPLPSLPVGR